MDFCTRKRTRAKAEGIPHGGMSRWIAASLLATTVLFAPAVSLGMSFAPNEAEWATWPEFCQARYTVSGAGRNSAFANRIDPSVVKGWEDRLGSEVWYGLHHYCGGLILAKRAQAEPDKQKRTLALTRVLQEYGFTLTRIQTPGPMRAEIAARKAQIHQQLGDLPEALRHFDMAIQDCPKCTVGYHAKATFFRGQGKLEEARKVLEEGNESMNGESAEIHYFLGLLLVEARDFPAAQEHARQAYTLGYPLPGLKDRLAKSGHPLD